MEKFKDEKGVFSFALWLEETYGWSWEYFDNNVSNPDDYYEEFLEALEEAG